eukprot:g16019.t1
MKYTSLPVYNVLKRMSPIAALFLDYFFRKKTYPLVAKLGMVCVFLGAIVTGSGDLELWRDQMVIGKDPAPLTYHLVSPYEFEALGYICALCAVMGQSSYLVLCARALDNLPGLSHVDVLFYTGFYNQFLFFPLAVMEGPEIQNFWTNTQIAPVYLLAVFALYVFQGTLLNYVTFWCTSVTSPVTTGVCGNIKALLTSLVGVVLFSARLSPLGWTGSTIVRLWLRKRGIDSLEAVARIATLLGLAAKKIGIAGIKDSKAVTQQAITVTLGCRFSSSPALEQAFASLQNKGFVNYIGLQRFGKGGVRSDSVGFLYLKRDYVACFEALLYGCYNNSSGSRGRPAADISLGARTCDATSSCSRPKPPWLSRFSRTGCAQTALRELGATTDGHLWLERRLLLAFAKCPPKSRTSSSRSYEEKCRYAFLSLPRCIRVLYVHGYLDRLWNLAASERIRKYGAEEAVVGDCVQVRPSTKRAAVDRLEDEALEVEPLLSSEEGAKNGRTSSSSSQLLLKRRRIEDIPEQPSFTASDDGHNSNHPAPGATSSLKKSDSNQSEEKQTFVKIIRTPAEAEKFSIFDVVLPRIGDGHLNGDLAMPENGVGQMMRDYLRGCCQQSKSNRNARRRGRARGA